MASKNISRHIADVVAKAGKIDVERSRASLDLLDQVAESLRSMRKKAGLSQKDLASQLGITQGRISQIESGLSQHAPSLEMIAHYAFACGEAVQIAPKRTQTTTMQEARQLAQKKLTTGANNPVVLVRVFDHPGYGVVRQRVLQLEKEITGKLETHGRSAKRKPQRNKTKTVDFPDAIEIRGEAARNIVEEVRTAGAAGNV